MPWARLLSISVLAVCLVGCVGRPVSAASSRDEPGTLQFGGLNRTYRVHVPPGPAAGLVLNLHGGGGTGAGQQALTDFDAVADVNNLVVVYPDGYDKSWADGRGVSRADRRHVDDVGFLVALTSKLVNHFGVAPGHVFATGMSNAEIATRLCISPATAKTHVAHLLTKLDARDRVQLVIIAYQAGLATAP